MIYTHQTNHKNKPKLSIGLPTYNGEDSIQRRLENILSQTFTDFELIISDNCSTDSTCAICERYSTKDERIRLIRQEKNMGWVRNFISVLEEAKGEYFVWATDDDLWSSNFLEKNVKILEFNKNVVGSVGRIEQPGVNLYKLDPNDSLIKKIYKTFRGKFRPFGTSSLSGSYEDRLRMCMKTASYQNIFAVFRTKELQKSIIPEPVPAWDAAMVLSVLKHGDIHVVDEVLISYRPGGLSSKTYVIPWRNRDLRFKELFFPNSGFGFWCANTFGLKFFLKSFDYFIWLVCLDLAAILIKPVRLIVNRISQEKNDLRSKND